MQNKQWPDCARRVIAFLVVGVAWLALSTGCSSTGRVQYPPGTDEPLITGIGGIHLPVTTDSDLAQRYFDQGLAMRYGFAFEAALRAFAQAASLDPDCAMAWWGVAWSVGPTFWGGDVSDENARVAWDALQRANALKGRASSLEQDLVEAISMWYAAPPVNDRDPLDRAYADAMAELWRRYSEHAEVGVIYSQALIADIGQAELWRRDAHDRPAVQRVTRVLRDVLAEHPEHPGAAHFYIHVVEASPQFRKAQPAADRLRRESLGLPHLVHMSSHIDVLAGNWDAAIEANERANELTRLFRNDLSADTYSPVWTHNYHFLGFACMMGGQCERGLRAGRELVGLVVEDRLATDFTDQWAASILYEILIRFGRWDEMLAEPQPPEDLPVLVTMWRFSRAVAYAASGDIEAAEREREAFWEMTAGIPSEDQNGRVRDLAMHVMQGEIAFHRGLSDEAVRQLRLAVAIEDSLNYSEPPPWHQPARHALGAVLITVGRFAEAEVVYRNDLDRWPNNGWSLHGLEVCLRARGAKEEADRVHSQFEEAWANADTEIGASCLCVLRDGSSIQGP